MEWRSPRLERADNKGAVAAQQALLRGLRWTLHYYLLGVPPWSWYLPYHPAPPLLKPRHATPILSAC